MPLWQATPTQDTPGSTGEGFCIVVSADTRDDAISTARTALQKQGTQPYGSHERFRQALLSALDGSMTEVNGSTHIHWPPTDSGPYVP